MMYLILLFYVYNHIHHVWWRVCTITRLQHGGPGGPHTSDFPPWLWIFLTIYLISVQSPCWSMITSGVLYYPVWRWSGKSVLVLSKHVLRQHVFGAFEGSSLQVLQKIFYNILYIADDPIQESPVWWFPMSFMFHRWHDGPDRSQLSESKGVSWTNATRSSVDRFNHVRL
jgi:hypothetical protein